MCLDAFEERERENKIIIIISHSLSTVYISLSVCVCALVLYGVHQCCFFFFIFFILNLDQRGSIYIDAMTILKWSDDGIVVKPFKNGFSRCCY